MPACAEPLPLPLRTCFEWAKKRRSPRRPGAGQRRKVGQRPLPGEDADTEQVLGLGGGGDLDRLLEARPLDGEELDGEATRLGALSCRIWAPMMDRVFE